ncbi:class I SAM-dependent methyltransferase [Rhodanobacter geophilus]|uniref:Class I SAM-dependent methyltransferase n=1 Tax=Rhodanobacter geophilus TaxID=3162488 RepID=A0ABV3QKY8_9GAMM
MLRRTRKLLIVLAALLLPGPAAASSTATSSPGDTAALLQKAVDGNWRSAADKARDRYRHPLETLQFFGIRPDMTVVELAPAGGWYTEILAPLLRGHGHLVEAPSPSPTFMARMQADPAVFGHFAQVLPFKPPAQVTLGAPGSADMVLTFRNTHDWLNRSPETLAAVFKAAFDVLRPGGVFGVTEHRAKPFAVAQESSKALHRLPEDYLIALGLKTGFRLGGVSEINANPKDPGNINVHRLPPDLAGPASEHAAMQMIGESDRMTLRFVKP